MDDPRAVERLLKPPEILGHGIQVFGNLAGRTLFPTCLDDLRRKRNRRIRNSGADHEKERALMTIARLDDVRGGFGQRNLLRYRHGLIFYFDRDAV